jgi:hypothetical protein
VGKGQGPLELIAAGLAPDFTLEGELRQGRAHGGGAQATAFLELLNGHRLVDLGQGLAHALERGGPSVGRGRGPEMGVRL